MTKIAANRTVAPKIAVGNFVLRWLAALNNAPLSRRDPKTLAQMPAERLADMGIPATTDANRRTSAQAGPPPHGELW